MKKFIALLLCGLMLFASLTLASCDDGEYAVIDAGEQTNQDTETQKPDDTTQPTDNTNGTVDTGNNEKPSEDEATVQVSAPYAYITYQDADGKTVVSCNGKTIKKFNSDTAGVSECGDYAFVYVPDAEDEYLVDIYALHGSKVTHLTAGAKADYLSTEESISGAIAWESKGKELKKWTPEDGVTTLVSGIIGCYGLAISNDGKSVAAIYSESGSSAAVTKVFSDAGDYVIENGDTPVFVSNDGKTVAMKEYSAPDSEIETMKVRKSDGQIIEVCSAADVYWYDTNTAGDQYIFYADGGENNVATYIYSEGKVILLGSGNYDVVYPCDNSLIDDITEYLYYGYEYDENYNMVNGDIVMITESGAVETLVSGDDIVWPESSADGRYVFYALEDAATLNMLDTVTKEVTVLAQNVQPWTFYAHPDGYVLYCDDDSNLYCMNYITNVTTRIAADVSDLHYEYGTDTIYFAGMDEKVYVYDLDTAATQCIDSITVPTYFTPDVYGDDAKSFYVVITDYESDNYEESIYYFDGEKYTFVAKNISYLM